MPDIRHVFTSPQVDVTGTITIWNGATTATVAASAIVKPSAWNASHAGGLDMAASNTTYTSGTVVLSGGPNVTVGTNGQTITISAAAQSVQSQNMVALSASDALFSSGTVVLSGQGAAVVNTAAGSIRISVPAQTAQTGISGIAGSNTTYTSGTVLLSGVGGGITVSSNTGQRMDLSVAAPVAQTVQTQSLVAALYDGAASISTGTVRLTNANGVSFSVNGQTLSGSVAAGATATGNVGGVAVNVLTTYTSGTVVLSAGNNITLGTNAQTVTISGVAAQTVQTQNLHNLTLSGNSTSAGAGYIQVSSGTLTLAGGNNITLSQNGNAVTISAANAGGAQTAISGIANSETTYTSGSVTLSALGAITIRSTTGQHFQLSVNSQTAQTQSNVAAIANSETTYQTGTVSLSVVGGAMTIRSTTGQAFQFSISQSAQPAQTGISGLANSQTTYTSGTVSLSELGAITIRSTTGNQYQFSVNAQTAQTGISGISNSNTTYTSGTVGLSELGAITIRSTTGNQFQFSVNAQTAQTQNMVALSASNNLYSSGTVVLSGAGGITVGTNAQTVTISGALDGTINHWIPFQGSWATNVQVGNGTLFIQPMPMPGYFSFDRALQYINVTLSTSSNSSWAGVISLYAGIYTRNGSSLSSASSGSTVYQFTNTSSNSVSVLNGMRAVSVPITATGKAGDYWVAVLSKTSTTNANWFTASNIALSGNNINYSGNFMVASNQSAQSLLGFGELSVTTAGLPSAIPLADISAAGYAPWRTQPLVNFALSTY